MVEAVPVLRASLLRNRAFRSWIGQRSAVHKEQIQAPIVVIVEQGNTRTHCLQQIFLGSVTRLIFEVDSGLPSYVGKSPRHRRWRLSRTLLGRRNGKRDDREIENHANVPEF